MRRGETRARALYLAAIVGGSVLMACGGGGGNLARSACEAPERALAEVNAARAAGAWCGLPAGPLVLHPALQAAAQSFADELAANQIPAGHIGADGSTLAQRMARVGYPHRVFENTAAGTDRAADTVAALIESPGHCRALTWQAATVAGMACASDGAAAYWVQLYGERP